MSSCTQGMELGRVGEQSAEEIGLQRMSIAVSVLVPHEADRVVNYVLQINHDFSLLAPIVILCG